MVFFCNIVEHNEYSDHQRHLSSTNARSDGSFGCQNLGLDEEGLNKINYIV
jgi:hypothetical protein